MARRYALRDDQWDRIKDPRGIDRADVGKVTGEQDHIHFEDGSALNKDGSWKHGGTDLTNKQKSWLNKKGWGLPE